MNRLERETQLETIVAKSDPYANSPGILIRWPRSTGKGLLLLMAALLLKQKQETLSATPVNDEEDEDDENN